MGYDEFTDEHIIRVKVNDNSKGQAFVDTRNHEHGFQIADIPGNTYSPPRDACPQPDMEVSMLIFAADGQRLDRFDVDSIENAGC